MVFDDQAVTDADSNKLSNLAFLDLSDDERDNLEARYRALSHNENELGLE